LQNEFSGRCHTNFFGETLDKVKLMKSQFQQLILGLGFYKKKLVLLEEISSSKILRENRYSQQLVIKISS